MAHHDIFFVLCPQKEELGVAGYGVSVTTLEEVFLRVGHGSEEVRKMSFSFAFAVAIAVRGGVCGGGVVVVVAFFSVGLAGLVSVVGCAGVIFFVECQ